MPKRQTRKAIPQGIPGSRQAEVTREEIKAAETAIIGQGSTAAGLQSEGQQTKQYQPVTVLPANPPAPTVTAPVNEPADAAAQAKEPAPNYGRRLLRTEHRQLPHLFTPDEQRRKVNALKATFAEVTRETAEQKEKKDEMKARMSKLLSNQQKLIADITNGEEPRDTVVEVYIAGDATVVQEVRTDTFETINVREPRPDERAPELWTEEIKPSASVSLEDMGPSTEAEEGESIEGEEEEEE
jgi:hypothetical protein